MPVNMWCNDADRTFNRPCGSPRRILYRLRLHERRNRVLRSLFLSAAPDHSQFMNERDPPREVAGGRSRVKP
jgi:hypothetical protein